MKQLINWFKSLFSSLQTNEESELNFDKANIPDHVAVIMDGNGRWASSKGLPRGAGHRTGVDTLKEIVQAAQQIGVKYFTAYAFSTENWKRPQKEVNFLMNLFEETFEQEIENFKDKNIKVKVIGYKERLPASVRKKCKKIMEETRENDDITVNIALDYGSRAELIEAVKKLGRDIEADKLTSEEINETELTKRLYTAGQPDPDLFIRPGGEYRISNFLLWQLAYTELYFTNTYWPDFNKEEFFQAIKEYQKRERRFGGLKKK